MIISNQELWDKVKELEQDLKQAKRNLLQYNGWHNTSRTPGSYWMWEKELSIGKVLVDEAGAIRIQAGLDSGYYNDMKKTE